MFRVLDLLLATVAQMAPVAEIDCSKLPAAGTAPFPYSFAVKLGFASGVTSEGIEPRVTRDGRPQDVADLLHGVMSGGKWATRQVGLSVFVYGYDGSPVTTAVVEGDGPQPVVRWWPLPRRKK